MERNYRDGTLLAYLHGLYTGSASDLGTLVSVEEFRFGIRETPSPLPWFRPGRCSVSKSKTASRSDHRANCPLGCLKFLIHFNALSSVPALNGFLIRDGEKCSIDRTQANSSFLVVL